MAENNFPSLSEFHDYEPNLEFDDSWMQSAISPLPPELEGLEGDEEIMPRSASDGTIEENFERELALPPRSYAEIEGEGDSFTQLIRSGLIEVAGDDQLGRLIVVVSACRLPPTKEVSPDTLLRFLMFTLDKFVEQDYSIVYLHYGITSESRPPLAWFWEAYKALDRKFKKNLKALYLVHPTKMIRILWQMFRPVISVKFGKKMTYVNYLHELQEHLRLDQLPIPDCVREYNSKILHNSNAVTAASMAGIFSKPSASQSLQEQLADVPKTQQFGVSLEFIRKHNPDIKDNIPPIVRSCIQHLSTPESLNTEGIFRRSTTQKTLTDMIAECNRGEKVNFSDAHCAAVLLKAFLRKLLEPILTYRLYDEIILFKTWPMSQRARLTKILLLEKLPIENYILLKFIIKFLWRVAEMSCQNKMTASNLAVVFGPNFLWAPEGHQTMDTATDINLFTEYLLVNQDEIFII